MITLTTTPRPEHITFQPPSLFAHTHIYIYIYTYNHGATDSIEEETPNQESDWEEEEEEEEEETLVAATPRPVDDGRTAKRSLAPRGN